MWLVGRGCATPFLATTLGTKKIYSARRRDVVADGTTPCEECGVPWCGKEHGTMVYCDGCNKAYHSLSCLHPPLIEIPEDDWFCPHCAVDTTASL